ncbi:hypothetical protein IFR05_006124 [Cadophora sp. M221]|nr:hypothetical protein IFR05_006124 [Cadophora sp. M221]
MEPLLAGYRERERTRSDSSIKTASTAIDSYPSHTEPAAFLKTGLIPTRSQPLSPAKRRIDETVEISRAKRSKSDPVDYHPHNNIKRSKSLHTSLQSDDKSEDSDCSTITGSMLNDDAKMELLILENTTKTLEALLANWKEANKVLTELAKSSDKMGQVVEHFLAKTTKQDVSGAAALKMPEQPKAHVLTPRSKDIAKELVRRMKSGYGDAQSLNPNLEMKHNVNLFYLMKITEGLDALPYNVAPTIWFILPTLRKERENAYHALISHPHIAQKTASSTTAMQKQLKQEVVDFFDKCFTYQVAVVHHVYVRLTGPLLRLGGDTMFKSSDGLDTGGENYRELDNYNQLVWQDLVIQSAEMSTQNNTNHPSLKRARGELSISSLGLTRLFLDDEEEMNYEEDDEATSEAQKLFSRDEEFRSDSAIDMDSADEACDLFYDPIEERVSHKQDDGDQ